MKFKVGAFLNIGYDHISEVEHKDFDEYFRCKIELLKNSEYIVINENLLKYKEVIDIINNKSKDKVFTFSISGNSDYKVINVENKKHFIEFDVVFAKSIKHYKLSMKGEYNIENALASIIICEKLGVDYKYIYKGLETAYVKGRGEIYESEDNKKILIVDYAHNELSLKKYFEFIKDEYKGKRHICIIGAPGGKALNRREEIGTLCYENSDDLILTSDDPFYEDFNDICLDIINYIDNRENLYIVESRTEAIKTALEMSEYEEVIISILGKGAETTQNYNGVIKNYISDSINARNFIDEYNRKNVK